jgi:alkanesulfonate monooxygenase SsuD/methylene tetrahydromethanopterin reductase-like flavin-dependent oxidoreductase (luciferase family)
VTESAVSNYRPPAQLGFLADLRNPPQWERPWAEHYGRTIEMIEEAERLGAGAIFFGEHHLTIDGYLPQPLTFAAAVAARTRRIRVGSSVTLAPLRHPMHIAEEAAVVDVLSGGRVELGLGAGYRPAEYEAFGVDRSQRHRLLAATIADVRRHLSEVTPRPVQERLPIWCGYIHPGGARRAGLLGEGLMTLRRDAYESYVSGLRDGGHDIARAQVSGQINLVIADDPERTSQILQPHFAHHFQQYGSFFDEVVEADNRPGDIAIRDSMRSATFPVLTPEDAISLIRSTVEGLPVKYFSLFLSIGGMPDEFVQRHIELATTVVAPAALG